MKVTTKAVKKNESCSFVQRTDVSNPSNNSQFSSLEKQLDWGKQKYALEHETLNDKAMTMYAAKLEHGAGVV